MQSRFTQLTGTLLGILVVAFIGVTLSTTSAHALLAAGTSIDNQATVSYNEGADVTSNTVSTTVNLVSGLVWDDTSLSPVTQSVSPGGTIIDYTVDLLNTGNGTTAVTLNDNTVNGANLNADSAFTTSPTIAANLNLVGTIASGPGVFGGVTTDIPVYNIDVAELEVGVTRIHINGVTGSYFTVAAGSTATNLVVTGDASGIVAGDQIGEVINITYSGDAATLASGTSGTHDHALEATDDVGGGLNADGNTAASDTVESNADGGAGTDWVTTIAIGVLTIDKYVRNVTNPVAGATSIPYDGNTYYQTGVTGNSDPDGAGPGVGDTLEYLIVITNAGPGDATNVSVADAISTYLSLSTATIDIDTNGDGTFDVTDAITNDAASFASPNLTVYPGAGGVASTTTGGTVAFDATPTTAIRFQVVIQ